MKPVLQGIAFMVFMLVVSLLVDLFHGQEAREAFCKDPLMASPCRNWEGGERIH